MSIVALMLLMSESSDLPRRPRAGGSARRTRCMLVNRPYCPAATSAARIARQAQDIRSARPSSIRRPPRRLHGRHERGLVIAVDQSPQSAAAPWRSASIPSIVCTRFSIAHPTQSEIHGTHQPVMRQIVRQRRHRRTPRARTARPPRLLSQVDRARRPVIRHADGSARSMNAA